MELARASRMEVRESAIFRGQKAEITEKQKDEMLEKQLQRVLQEHIVLIEGVSEASVTVTVDKNGSKAKIFAPAFVSVGLISGKELTEHQQSSIMGLVTGSTGLPEEDVILTIK